MSRHYPDGFWTFVRACGCPYGSLVGDHTTPFQAWADFYEDRAADRRKAEALGCSCRPAQAGDLERLQATCEHGTAVAS